MQCEGGPQTLPGGCSECPRGRETWGTFDGVETRQWRPPYVSHEARIELPILKNGYASDESTQAMAPMTTISLTFDVKTNDYLVWQGQVVMSRSEEPYFRQLFKHLAKALRPTRVLEIGFGLGISANLVQR